MSLEGSQVPPRPAGASATTSERPPVAAIVLSLVDVKKPIRRLSGDQKGRTAPVASSSRRATLEESDRTHSSESAPLTLPTMNATVVPSGEITTPVESGNISVPAGDRIDRRIAPWFGATGARGQRRATAPAVRTTPASAGQKRATSEGRPIGAAAAPLRSTTAGDSGSSSSRRASPMALSRRRGSFSRQRRSRRRRGRGRSAGSASQSTSSLITLASVTEMSSPSKARRPVSISYSTTPKAQMSARRSTALPRACSGAM